MDESKVYTILLEIHKQMGVISSDISKVEIDLKEHMRRTAVVEANIEALNRSYYRLQGAFGLVSLLATCAAIYHYVFR